MKFEEYLKKMNADDLIVSNGEISIDIEGTPIRTTQQKLSQFCEKLRAWEIREKLEFEHIKARYHIKSNSKHHMDQHLVFQDYSTLWSKVKERVLMIETSQSLEKFLAEIS